MPEILVQWLLPDGSGAAPLPEGGAVHLPGALPGDRVAWREVGRRGRTVQGEVVERLQPAPDRQTPPCPWDAACGGCDLSGLQPQARHEALALVVARAFRLPEPPELVPSPRPTGHRARVKLAIEGRRLGFRAARSHDLVEVGTCGVARPELQQALGEVRRWLQQAPPGVEGLTHVELRSDGQGVVHAFASTGLPRPVRESLAALGDVALDGRALHGDPRLWLQVAGVRLRASPRSFYQVNLEANALLVAHVLELVEALAPERLLDLYCGIGNFSLPIATRGVPVVGVELEGQATADLRASAEALHPPPALKVVEAPVERFDPSREPFDVALLDPPRAGAPGVVGRLLRNRPRALIYVSCHAPAAARDLREAQRAGYRLTRVRCFDLFPDTHHVETVVVAER